MQELWDSDLRTSIYLQSDCIDRYMTHDTYPAAGIKCDISVGGARVRFGHSLILSIRKMDYRVDTVMALVKQWARNRALNNAQHGTLSSHLLNLMVPFPTSFICPWSK